MDLKKTDIWLKRNKEGMIFGSLIGFLIYYFNISIPYLIFKPEISNTTKLFSLIFIGMTIGALVDSWIKPKV